MLRGKVMLTLMLALALASLSPAVQGTPGRPAPRKALPCGDVLSVQILLDRRGISPGEIDGVNGRNLRQAVLAFQESSGLRPTGAVDCAAWQALAEGGPAELLVEYIVSAEDVEGPFLTAPLPGDLLEQSRLPALSYGSVLEALAERFHASPRLLSTLNPGTPFTAGTTIRVPAVEPFERHARPQPDAVASVTTIRVSRARSQLRVERSDGSVVFVAPVSSGSDHDPLPIGTWKVTGTAWMPPFQYNPTLFWDAEPGHSRATIKPGPNNPVGVVWIDISVPHYGLHGTPTPNLVGHAQSHGCVRLTNWDAVRLTALVRPGTTVVFEE